MMISQTKTPRFINIIAGSGYGSRCALYELVEGVLVLRDEGNHDNLVGNSQALDFEGVTLEQANEKASTINSEGSGHTYDGCHLCNFSINITETEPPSWYTYQDPAEAAVIRDALAVFRAKK